MKPRIYLAGPTVFQADADDAGARLVALCEQYGCDGLYPLDFDLDGPMSSRTIQAACLRELQTADGVVADLSPFRGPHADDGTAFELGFAHALGIPIWAYTIDPRPLIDRIAGARHDGARAGRPGPADRELRPRAQRHARRGHPAPRGHS